MASSGSSMFAGNQEFQLFSTAFPGHEQKAGTKVQQLGPEPVPIYKVST